MQTGKWIAGAALAAFFAVGCEDSGYQEYGKAPLSEGHDHDHDHGDHEGKHGGHVLELDDAHGFHAEMVFDKETRDITLYFYGSEIGVAQAATELEFELEKDGDEVALESKASPLEGETEATASRYVIAGSQIPENITGEEQLDGHFHVTIADKSLVGSFHPHSHDEHDEEGHSEHGHDEAHDEKHGDNSHAEDAHGEKEHAAEDAEHKADGEKSGDAAAAEEKPAAEEKASSEDAAPKAE